MNIILALAPSKFPEPPLQPVRPVDEIEMANTYQGALVISPSTRLYTDQSIVEPLGPLDDRMRSGEYRPFVRLKTCTVRIVLDIFDIRCPLIEAVLHILLCELGEGTGFESEVLHNFVYPLDLTRCESMGELVSNGGGADVRPMVSNI